MRRVNTNKTHILHRIRIKFFVSNTPVQDNYSREKLHPGDEIVLPLDDMHTISWEVDFDYELFETRKDNWPDMATRTPNDAASGGVDDYVTEEERSSVNENERSSEKRNDRDVTEIETRPRSANSRDTTSPLNEPPNLARNENDVTNELNDAENVSMEAQILPFPEYQKTKIPKKFES